MTVCVYQDCLSVKYPCSKIAFFCLPTDDRRSTWIRNSGNKALLKIGEKANRFFCEKHFRECDINSQFNRKILRKHAVPKEHASLGVKPIEIEVTKISANGSIEVTQENKAKQDSTDYVVELNLEDNSLNETVYEEVPSLDHLLEFYETDDGIVLTNKPAEAQEETDKRRREENEDTVELYYAEETSNNNQVDSSTLELELHCNLENSLDSEDITESEIPAKKKRSDAMEFNKSAKSESVATQSNHGYEEDKHYALSLIGYFQRLPQRKKALAKLKILQYLTELEMNLPTSL